MFYLRDTFQLKEMIRSIVLKKAPEISLGLYSKYRDISLARKMFENNEENLGRFYINRYLSRPEVTLKESRRAQDLLKKGGGSNESNPSFKKAHFIVVRYSVLIKGSRAWNISKGINFEDYKKSLFNDQRLKNRLELFKKITLPSFISQNKISNSVPVRMLVLTSSELPKKHLKKLSDVLNLYQDVDLKLVRPSDKISSSINQYLLENLSGSECCYSTIRLDDDDALSRDFIEKIDAYTNLNYLGYALSFSLGYGAELDQKCNFIRANLRHRLFTAQGLSFIGGWSKKFDGFLSYGNVYEVGSHSTIYKSCKVIVDSETPSYVRTFYDDQDTGARDLDKDFKSGEAVSIEELKAFVS